MHALLQPKHHLAQVASRFDELIWEPATEVAAVTSRVLTIVAVETAVHAPLEATLEEEQQEDHAEHFEAELGEVCEVEEGVGVEEQDVGEVGEVQRTKETRRSPMPTNMLSRSSTNWR